MLTAKHIRALLRMGLAAVVFAALTHTRADPDLFGHIRFGHDIVSAGSVHLLEPYSFTSDKPWINHEWLSESMMYLAYAAAGTAGLIMLKLTLLLVMLAAVIAALRAGGVPESTQDVLVAMAVVDTFAQTNHIRPQLFSLALFGWLLIALVTARRRPLAQLWLVPIMAVWVNLHGGWIVGAGTIAAWTFVGLLTDASARSKLFGGCVAVAAIGVTIVNPYGWRLWTFIYQTVGLRRPDITDWQPVFAVGIVYGVLWTIVAATAVAGLLAGLKRRAFDRQALAVVFMCGLASFHVSRLTAFFAVSTTILLGPLVATIAREPHSLKQQNGPVRFASITAVALALVLIIGGVTASARNVSCIRLQGATFPEPGIVPFIARHRLHGRMLTWFDWGEYAVWHFSPAMAISMDGRRETVYSDETIRQHLHFYFAPAERQAILNVLQPDFIWVPSSLDVARQLASDGWTPLFAGDRSVLLAKHAASEANPVLAPTTDRCFPGP